MAWEPWALQSHAELLCLRAGGQGLRWCGWWVRQARWPGLSSRPCLLCVWQISDIQVSGQSEDMTAKEKLLLWSQRMVEGYQGLRCDNFTTSWRDGRLFNAIIHRHKYVCFPGTEGGWRLGALQPCDFKTSQGRKAAGGMCYLPLLEPGACRVY